MCDCIVILRPARNSKLNPGRISFFAIRFVFVVVNFTLFWNYRYNCRFLLLHGSILDYIFLGWVVQFPYYYFAEYTWFCCLYIQVCMNRYSVSELGIYNISTLSQKKYFNSLYTSLADVGVHIMASKCTWMENIEDSVQISSKCFITRISRNFQNIIERLLHSWNSEMQCWFSQSVVYIRYQWVEDSCFNKLRGPRSRASAININDHYYDLLSFKLCSFHSSHLSHVLGVKFTLHWLGI